MVLLAGNLTSVILVLKEKKKSMYRQQKQKITHSFLLEEYQLGDFRYELGFRQEWQSLLNRETQKIISRVHLLFLLD